MTATTARVSPWNFLALLKRGDLLFVLALFGTIILLVVPVPAVMLDLLLAASIGISLLMLLIIIYVKDPPEFSAFPTLLLAVTLYRLALNVASTRLILTEGHAGAIIEAFGSFVVRGNYVIGAVIFLILIVIKRVVILLNELFHNSLASMGGHTLSTPELSAQTRQYDTTTSKTIGVFTISICFML